MTTLSTDPIQPITVCKANLSSSYQILYHYMLFGRFDQEKC